MRTTLGILVSGAGLLRKRKCEMSEYIDYTKLDTDELSEYTARMLLELSKRTNVADIFRVANRVTAIAYGLREGESKEED